MAWRRRISAQYYAQRTLLKREVLPDHVADAVFALTGSVNCPGPPACTSPSTPASRPPFSGEPFDRLWDRRRRYPSRPFDQLGDRIPFNTTSSAAIDIGASSGRVVAGPVDRRRRRVGRRAPLPQRGQVNPTRTCAGTLTGLYEQVLVGLSKLSWRGYPQVQSLGIDTWAVDYGSPRRRTATLLAEPVAYRDEPHRARWIKDVHALIDPERLYAYQRPAIPALQHDLPARRPSSAERYWRRAPAMPSCCPIYSRYWLTGEFRTEITNASTTGLLDARPSRSWSVELLDRAQHPGRPPSRR